MSVKQIVRSDQQTVVVLPLVHTGNGWDVILTKGDLYADYQTVSLMGFISEIIDINADVMDTAKKLLSSLNVTYVMVKKAHKARIVTGKHRLIYVIAAIVSQKSEGEIEAGSTNSRSESDITTNAGSKSGAGVDTIKHTVNVRLDGLRGQELIANSKTLNTATMKIAKKQDFQSYIHALNTAHTAISTGREQAMFGVTPALRMMCGVTAKAESSSDSDSEDTQYNNPYSVLGDE